MHPAFSVIVFTTLSGAGFGLIALIGLGIGGSGPHPLVAPALAFGLALVGLGSSVFHLRHPERAWRAFSQWRSSWLSREGVLAILALATFLAHLLLLRFVGGRGVVSGLIVAVLAMLTVHSTAMIYASLSTVSHWRTPLTPLVYLAFSLAGGMLASVALAGLGGRAPVALVLSGVVLLAIAWGLKIAWWRRAAGVTSPSTIETATGLAGGPVRQFEPPHREQNYLTREMGYRVARSHAVILRKIALLLGAFVPAALLLVVFAVPVGRLVAAGFLVTAFVVHLIGVLVERWLFFAEAKHTVSLYYGAQTA